MTLCAPVQRGVTGWTVHDGSYQAVLSVPVTGASALEQVLHGLELAHPPLLRLTVHRRDDRLSVFLDFDGAVAFEVHRPLLELTADDLQGHLVDLSALADEQRAALFMPAREGRRHSDVASAMRGVAPAGPHLTLEFPSDSALLTTWARSVAEGGLYVPGSFSGDSVALTLQTPGRVLRGNLGRRLSRPPRDGRTGVWLEIEPDEAFSSLLGSLSSEHGVGRRPRVLVVDDEAIWRSTLSRMLTAMGIEVVVAGDGRQGLNALIDGFFELDLVVLDLHMPDIDGRGLIERVRRFGGEHALRIFLFSGATADELLPLGSAGQATRVFSKIEPIDRLREAIEAELSVEPFRESFAA